MNERFDGEREQLDTLMARAVALGVLVNRLADQEGWTDRERTQLHFLGRRAADAVSAAALFRRLRGV